MSIITRARRKLAEIIGGAPVMRNLTAADLFFAQVRVPPQRGSWEFLLAYRSSPLLRMLVATVAKNIAAVEWHVSVPGKKGPRIIDDHPLGKLLRSGNEVMTGHQIRKLTAIHYQLTGEAHWLLERNALGVPVAILPMVPTWMVTTPRPGRPWYDVAVTEGGFVGRIAASEILTFKDIDPYRPYDRGTGLAMALDNELQGDDAAAKYTASYLANNARPDLIITGNTNDDGPGLTKEEADALKSAWMDRFQGPSQRGLPLFASGDLKVQEIGKTMAEMQFVDLRKFERDFCLTVFGIPPEIVSVLQNSNRATAETAQLVLGRQVLKPMLSEFKETIQQFLVPQFDAVAGKTQGIQVDFDDPTPDDTQAVQQALSTRPWMATVNEHRTAIGLDELDGPEGELFPVPTLMSFESDLEESEDVPVVSPLAPAKPGNGAPPPNEDNELGKGLAFRRRLSRSTPLKEDNDKPSEADIAAIQEAAAPGVLILATSPVVNEVMRAFGEDAMTIVGAGVAFDVTDPNVAEFLRTFGADRMTGMVNETTRRAIGDAIASTWEAGGTQDDIIDAISGVFDEANASRASMIAATETNRAANFGTMEGFDQAGVPGKEWLSTQDDRVRDTHRAMDGEQKAVDEDFVSPSGDHGPYPGEFQTAAESINCRCHIVPVMDYGKSIGLNLDSEEKRSTYWEAQDRRKLAFERLMTTRLKGAFAKQKSAVLNEARRRFR